MAVLGKRVCFNQLPYPAYTAWSGRITRKTVPVTSPRCLHITILIIVLVLEQNTKTITGLVTQLTNQKKTKNKVNALLSMTSKSAFTAAATRQIAAWGNKYLFSAKYSTHFST